MNGRLLGRISVILVPRNRLRLVGPTIRAFERLFDHSLRDAKQASMRLRPKRRHLIPAIAIA